MSTGLQNLTSITGPFRPTSFALLLCLVACGDDGDDGNSENPKEACNTLLENLCDKVASCQIESGDIAASEKDSSSAKCREGVAKQGLNCDEAVAGPSSLDQCLEDVDALPCAQYPIAADNTPQGVPQSCAQ